MPRRAYHSGRVHWTLTVEWAGQVFRWATSPLEIETEAGDVLSFDDGLEPIDYEDSLQGLGVASARSIPVEVFFPPEVDVSEWIARGYDLASATGEVALWSEDTVWEERRVVLAGPVREPEYGSMDEPVSFSIEDAVASSGAVVPDLEAVVTSETWPDAPEGDIGRTYPIVWGRPGYLEDTTGTESGATAPIAVAAAINEKIVVAGHPVQSATVRVFDSDNARETFSITQEVDGRGRTVSVVDISGAATIDTLSEAFYTGWIDQNALVDGNGEVVDTVGKLISYLLQLSDMPVDLPAWAAIEGELGLATSGFIDEAVSPFDWLTDHIFPYLPLSILPGPDGYYPVLWRLQAVAGDAVTTISPDTDPSVERVGRLTYSKLSDVVNGARVSYCLDALDGDFRRTTILSTLSESGTYSEGSTYYAELSQARYGERPETIELDWCWSRATASYVALQTVLKSALPSREVSYSVGYELGWLRLGDVVLVSDEEVHLDREVGLVIGLRWTSEEELSVRVLLLARPELAAGVE